MVATGGRRVGDNCYYFLLEQSQICNCKTRSYCSASAISKDGFGPYKNYRSGDSRAPQDVKISAEVGGYVTKVAFADGQAVKKGDLLFQLDNAKEQADLLSMQAAYEGAKNKYSRMQNLLKLHYASEQDIDVAHADLQAKLAAVKTAQDNVNKKAITAPFDGVVGARTVSEGDFVTTGQKLVELVDRSLLKVDYSVPEKYWQEVKLDQPVAVTTSDSSGGAFAGKVVYISPAIDPQTHLWLYKPASQIRTTP